MKCPHKVTKSTVSGKSSNNINTLIVFAMKINWVNPSLRNQKLLSTVIMKIKHLEIVPILKIKQNVQLSIVLYNIHTLSLTI